MLRVISNDFRLWEQYRRAAVNYQVADLLDARALGAESSDQSSAWERRAAERRKLGDRLVEELLNRLPTESRA